MVDALRQKLGSGVVVLASGEDGKVALITAAYEQDLCPSSTPEKSSKSSPKW